MKSRILLLISVFILTTQVYSQISYGGHPLTFNKNELAKEIPLKTLGKVDIASLLKEDAFDLKAEDIPLRFGIDLTADYNLTNSGEWVDLPNGGRVWRLSIKSEGAYSLNFILQNFYLPEGAQLFLFNSTKQFQGSFTSMNNNAEREFATSPLSGDVVTFELYEPHYAKGLSTFEIGYVIHAYRNVFGIAKDYGGAGSCNVNINCPQGAPWQNQKRAVAMILTANNTRICSGALINNVRQDGTPYFLTANHCLSGSTSNTWIFMFNYESPACTNVNGPTNQTVQGSIIRATDTPSDFALLELTTAPPTTYNVYFAGWNAIDIPSDSCVGIHHPSGDIKKITFDFDTVASTGYSGAGNDHWRIASWNVGTTEGGSSGSPLFDKNKRIIGQLHGGLASCSNTTGYDVYGKFAYSWQMGIAPNKRIKDWLDPDSTGALTLDGADFNTPQNNYDAALAQINAPTNTTLCQLEVTPEITIRNNGANALTSLTIKYQLNTDPVQTFVWTGNLNYLETATFTLPYLQLNQGQQNLLVYVTNPNNVADQNSNNDTLVVSFNTLLGNGVILNLTTDNYSDETSWKLLDSVGTVLYSSSVLSDQTIYNDLFCLPNGCYNFIILDTYGDGMAGGTVWNPSPPGTYAIVLMGDTLGSGSGNFGFSDSIPFCVNTAGINKPEIENIIKVYPNPASNYVNIEIGNMYEKSDLEVFSINGQHIAYQELNIGNNRINTSSFARGVYFFKITNNNSLQYYKVVITRN